MAKNQSGDPPAPANAERRPVERVSRAEIDAFIKRARALGPSTEPGRRGRLIFALAAAAGELGLRGVPVFVFQEGGDPVAEQAFREIARLTRGAYCRFDAGAAHQLAELLRAVAAYAAGGLKALRDLSAARGAATLLLEQLK